MKKKTRKLFEDMKARVASGGHLTPKELDSLSDEECVELLDVSQPHSAPSFHSLAMGILHNRLDNPPLGRAIYDGFKGDAWLSEADYQRLYQFVCEHSPDEAADWWRGRDGSNRDWEGREAARLAILERAVARLKDKSKRRGRKKKTERDLDSLVISALCRHHEYDGGSVSNWQAASNRSLAAEYDVATNALTRCLRRKNVDARKYRMACINGSLGALLTLWRGEMPSRHVELNND